MASKLLPLGLTVVLAVAAFALGLALWRRADGGGARLDAAGLVRLALRRPGLGDAARLCSAAADDPACGAGVRPLVAGAGRAADPGAVLPAGLRAGRGDAGAVGAVGWSGRNPSAYLLPPLPRRERGIGGPSRAESRPWRRSGTTARDIGGRCRTWLLGRSRWWRWCWSGWGNWTRRATGRPSPGPRRARCPSSSRAAGPPTSSRIRYEFWIESSRSGFALEPKDTLLEDLPVLTIPFVAGGRAGRLAGWPGASAGRRRRAVPRSGGAAGAPAGRLLAAVCRRPRAALQSCTCRRVTSSSACRSSGRWPAGSAGCCSASGSPPGSADDSGQRRSVRLGSLAGLTGARRSGWWAWRCWWCIAPPPGDFYVTGRHPAIYAYLRQTPPDTLVGALPADSNILPMLGQRSILTSFEHALPYQPGYYVPLRERTEAFRAAYYAPTLAPLVEVLDEYGRGRGDRGYRAAGATAPRRAGAPSGPGGGARPLRRAA